MLNGLKEELLSPYQTGQQTGPVVPIFKKSEWRVCSNYQGITAQPALGKEKEAPVGTDIYLNVLALI